MLLDDAWYSQKYENEREGSKENELSVGWSAFYAFPISRSIPLLLHFNVLLQYILIKMFQNIQIKFWILGDSSSRHQKTSAFIFQFIPFHVSISWAPTTYTLGLCVCVHNNTSFSYCAYGHLLKLHTVYCLLFTVDCFFATKCILIAIYFTMWS